MTAREAGEQFGSALGLMPHKIAIDELALVLDRLEFETVMAAMNLTRHAEQWAAWLAESEVDEDGEE